MNPTRTFLRVGPVLLAVLTASSCFGPASRNPSTTARIDAALGVDGLRVTVRHEEIDPGQPQGGGESVGGFTYVRVEDWVISDSEPARTVVSEEIDPTLVSNRQASVRAGDQVWSLTTTPGALRLDRDGAAAATTGGVLSAALGPVEGQGVTAVAMMNDYALRTWTAGGAAAAPLEQSHGNVERPANGAYGPILLSAGPVFGLAVFDSTGAFGAAGLAKVWTAGGGLKNLGPGEPIAAWTSTSESRAVVALSDGKGWSPSYEYALVDGSGTRLLAGVQSEATHPGKVIPCAAAAFTAGGTALLLLEEKSALRLTEGSRTFGLPRPAGYVQQCFVFAEKGTSRVHVVVTASPSLAVQRPMRLHQMVLVDGAVELTRVVDLTGG